MPTADGIANYFLHTVREHGDYLTNLKLQKLLYYAQGWTLALTDEPLFEDKVEAWVHGPVVASVYGRFKECRWNPITEDVTAPRLRDTVLVEEVLEKYGRLSAFDLERMTHEELPWKIAREGLAPETTCRREITKDSMRRFFKSKLR